MVQAAPSSGYIQPKQITYCGVCSYPVEYCAYGSKLSKCKKWLSGAHPDLFTKYYGDDASTSSAPAAASKGDGDDKEEGGEVSKTADKMGGLSLEEEALKKEAKAERKAAKAEAQKMSSKILIKRQERTKRKMTTSIQGLEVFGIDLKKASKLFANKFATGASVSKNPQGEDEIVIQGDVAYEVEEMLLKKTGKEGDVFGGKVPEDNIDIIDVKKKKKAEEE
ncbi:density-regulated protein DRP1 [Cystobasidium minutum MCA 4210]|uniref:density-regulated protein DRP1 n=1 Tax=Cystobasidium minutum MCA 4210 TaxID=1397322 RepID=UPI0034CE9ADC|eukprot:jgi/Rhomi1/195340/gm1.3554_g